MIPQDRMVEMQSTLAKKSLIIAAWLALAIVISLGANILILYLGTLKAPPSYAVTSSGSATPINNFELSGLSAEELEKASKNPSAKVPVQATQGPIGVDD